MRTLRSSAALALACVVALVASAVPALAAPPRTRIKHLTLGRHVLPATGGATALRFDVAHGATCWVTAPAAVHVSRRHRGCRHGHMATVVRLKANDSLRPAHYRIDAWVHGLDGRTLKRAVVLGEQGLSPLHAALSATAQPQVGKGYTGHLVAKGGRGPYAWSVVGGALPPGLALSPKGALSGTPTAAGRFTADVKVSDASVPVHLTQTVKLTLTVAPPALGFAAPQLPQGTVGQAYTATLGVSGGTGPYTWSLKSGALPGGVVLSPGGSLSGAPTTAGTFSAVVQVTDASPSHQQATESISIVVKPVPLAVVTSSVPQAYVATAYSARLGATGGTAPYHWFLASGALPSGLALSTDGTISGTPTTAGTATMIVRAVDSSNPQQSVTVTVSITVSTSLAITTTSLPAATHGTKYTSTALAATGGTAPYTWAWAANGSTSLPPGLSLSSTGTLSGTPTTAGTYSFVVVVADASSPLRLVAQKTFSLTVS